MRVQNDGLFRQNKFHLAEIGQEYQLTLIKKTAEKSFFHVDCLIAAQKSRKTQGKIHREN